jgi:nickel/cobalt transporter (NicO) family protein
MRIVAPGRTVDIARFVILVAVVTLAAALVDDAFAQGFGRTSTSTSTACGLRLFTTPLSTSGVVGWILSKAAEFDLQFRALIRASKADGSVAWSLMGVSFLYGVFHAAGPGHGKAVISSYLVANDETWRRGVVLSFLSALMQAAVAVVFVAVARQLLNATAASEVCAANWIETLSYLLIILIGLRLFWVKGRAFIAAARAVGRPTGQVGAAVTANIPDKSHGHHHHDHDQGYDHHHAHSKGSCCEHEHSHHHHDHDDEASAWGHAHAPEPEELAGPGGWRRGLSTIVAVGLRPCSGAILVLVFAFSQGLFWVGVISTFVMGLGTFITVAVIASLAVGAKSWASRIAGTRSSYGTLAMRGIEVGAAVVVVGFGTLLLTGFMATERMSFF